MRLAQLDTFASGSLETARNQELYPEIHLSPRKLHYRAPSFSPAPYRNTPWLDDMAPSRSAAPIKTSKSRKRRGHGKLGEDDNSFMYKEQRIQHGAYVELPPSPGEDVHDMRYKVLDTTEGPSCGQTKDHGGPRTARRQHRISDRQWTKSGINPMSPTSADMYTYPPDVPAQYGGAFHSSHQHDGNETYYSPAGYPPGYHYRQGFDDTQPGGEDWYGQQPEYHQPTTGVDFPRMQALAPPQEMMLLEGAQAEGQGTQGQQVPDVQHSQHEELSDPKAARVRKWRDKVPYGPDLGPGVIWKIPEGSSGL